MMKIIGIVSIAAAIALICVAALFSLDAASDHGKEVFAAQKCSMCHSIEGAGGKMKSLDGIGSKLKAEEIRKWIVTPKEMKEGVIMKAYPDLPEKDLQDLVAYLVSLR
jgi:cytochrome c2